MDERLWNDIRALITRRLNSRYILAKTKAQKRLFWLVEITDDFVRVRRERSTLPFEDIPKEDFIDIWRDLNIEKYISKGYQQADLHGGQNRHCAVSFALVGMLPYIEWKRVGIAWKLFLIYPRVLPASQ
jgi:hypothetical protein